MSLVKVSKGMTSGMFGRNILINGGFIVNQRGNTTNIPATPTYVADRWTFQISGGTGMSGTCGASAVSNTESGFGGGFFSCSWTGGQPSIVQKIEAANSRCMNGQTVTISGKLYHTLGSTRTVTVYLFKAGSLDTFTSPVLIGSFPITAADGLTSFSGSIAIPAGDASNGIEIIIQDGAASTVSSKNFYVGDVQLEIGSTATAFEHRSFAYELSLCQRYYEKSFDYASAVGTATTVGAVMGIRGNGSGIGQAVYKVSKRTATTPTIYSPVTGTAGKVRNVQTASDQDGAVGNASESGFYVSAGAANVSEAYHFQWMVSAEL